MIDLMVEAAKPIDSNASRLVRNPDPVEPSKPGRSCSQVEVPRGRRTKYSTCP